MMFEITYKEYLNKVLGCWLGKCISGNIGAPYEGMKQLLNYEYSPKLMEEVVPNDDLDLQVLWLAVLEKYGISFTAEDLAQAFAATCDYAPGEYAYFKKNYKRGIHPPLSGEYCNTYFLNGMGCPIRSEIWACIAPGNPSLAAEFCEQDGTLDHKGDSVSAEKFLAAIEASAFFENDLDKLIEIGLFYLPQGSRIRSLVEDVQNWCRQYDNFKYIRSLIIRDYGHSDCTNLYQNIGFTLTALYCSKLDFMECTMIALNCGFDTDCTCATAGAILGILLGGKTLIQKYGFGDLEYTLGIRLTRSDYTVTTLAVDTCKMGAYIATAKNHKVSITDFPYPVYTFPKRDNRIQISVSYQDNLPAIGIQDFREITLKITNNTVNILNGELAISGPETISLSYQRELVLFPGDNFLKVDCQTGNIPYLSDTNLFHAALKIKTETFTCSFGLAGAIPWRIYGPFWENITTFPKLEIGNRYWAFTPENQTDEKIDYIREYHLNTFADIEKEYMTPEEIEQGIVRDPDNAAYIGFVKNTYFEKLSIDSFIGFEGPCTVYAKYEFISEKEINCGIILGCSDAVVFWMNGKLLAKKTEVGHWTSENIHLHNMTIKKGKNTVLLRLSRRTSDSTFNLNFVTSSCCTDHLTGFRYINQTKAE